MGLSDRQRSLTISLAIWIQHTIERDGRTDTADSKDRAYAYRAVINDNNHMLKWKSFKCILVTIMMSMTNSDIVLQNFTLNGRSRSIFQYAMINFH